MATIKFITLAKVKKKIPLPIKKALFLMKLSWLLKPLIKKKMATEKRVIPATTPFVIEPICQKILEAGTNQ